MEEGGEKGRADGRLPAWGYDVAPTLDWGLGMKELRLGFHPKCFSETFV